MPNLSALSAALVMRSNNTAASTDKTITRQRRTAKGKAFVPAPHSGIKSLTKG